MLSIPLSVITDQIGLDFFKDAVTFLPKLNAHCV